MTDDLFFIPIIADAISQPDLQPALQEAFAEIKQLGLKSQFRRGFAQYQTFMDAAVQHTHKSQLDSLEGGIIRELIIELATDTFAGNEEQRQSTLDLIRSRPEWQKAYEQSCAEAAMLLESPPVHKILVKRQNRLVGTISLEQLHGRGSVDNITPGDYTLAFDTGRILWEGKLEEQHLVWSAAFPDFPLELAAGTGEKAATPTQEISLLNNELVLRVYAGVENGYIQVEVLSTAVQ